MNGSKTFITSSTRADFITTAVRTGDDPHHGVSLIVVDTGSAGFSVVRRSEKMGWLCSDTGELSYVDVRVPATNLIGDEGSGFAQVAQLAVHGYGVAQRALDLTVAWTRDRMAFGKPLIAKQVVRHKLVEMARAVEVSRQEPSRRTRLIFAFDATSPACRAVFGHEGEDQSGCAWMFDPALGPAVGCRRRRGVTSMAPTILAASRFGIA